jgi:hypothetical protein
MFFRTADNVGNAEKSFSAPPTASGTQKNVFPQRRQRREHRKMFFHSADSAGNTEKCFSATKTTHDKTE